MLTKEERIAALERVRDDQGGTENRKFKKEQVVEALLDVRTWLVVLTTMLSKSLVFFCGVCGRVCSFGMLNSEHP